MYSDELLKYDFGPFHPLKPERLSLTLELIKNLDLLNIPKSSLEPPRTADADEILLFHTSEYVKHVRETSENGQGTFDMGDTPVFRGCFEASSIVVGATLKAIDLIMAGDFDHGFNPGGGLHHAHRDHASGFCMFNDAAIGIAYLKNHFGLKRIMYVDMDAHHGDGVMYGFYSDPSVLDIDFHEDGHYLFPGTGQVSEIGEGNAEGLKINVPLPPLTSDTTFIYAFDRLVPRLAAKFKPEFVILQCGADAHRDDGLAYLGLTTRTYQHVASTIHDISNEYSQGKALALGGGGYNLLNTARCWSIVYGVLTEANLPEEIPVPWKSRFELVTGENAPAKLRDNSTELHGEKNRVRDNVVDTVRQIETIVRL